MPSKQVYLSFFVLAFCGFGCGPKHSAAPPPADIGYDANGANRPHPITPDPFMPRVVYDSNITAPQDLLGFEVGSIPARPDQILDCFKRWAEASPRAAYAPYAVSAEGRELARVVITSEENLKRIDAIKADIAKLNDPRNLSQAEADRILDSTPAIAWIGFSIHGNELSGADASLAVGYYFIAGTNDAIVDILEKVVIVLDPVMNPDGRERTITNIEQQAGQVPNLDYASLHRGRWPWGRGNHYLFDMNRDWIVGIAPETRGRWQVLLEFNPQLVIDVHEMWALDTYLFYPPSEPINPHRPPHVIKWQQVFAANHAAAFDALGWSYYTREWAEGWYPGYTDAWASLGSAVGMLYEQARFHGQSLRRPSGRVATYSESVRAQAISSLSDLTTLAHHRKDVLNDYLSARRLPFEIRNPRVFALRPGRSPDRERMFLRTLLRQGIEIATAKDPFTARKAFGTLGMADGKQKFPVGTYLITEAQPQGALVKALLDLDPRISDEVLKEERTELERRNESTLYDVTAWDLAHAFDLDGFWIDDPGIDTTPVTKLAPTTGEIVATAQGATYAWVVDGWEDASLAFAIQAMALDITVRVAQKPFTTGGRQFERGSLLIRRQENTDDVAVRIKQAAQRTSVDVFATPSGRSPGKGPDLGGQEFKMLHRPRIAVLSNWPVWPSAYGHVWRELDAQLGISVTHLDIQMLKQYDLRRYNVLVLPPADDTLGALLTPHKEALKAWLHSGGTLVAIGSAAAIFTNEALNLGTVRLRRDVVPMIDSYEEAAGRDLAARDIQIDPAAIWDAADAPVPQPQATGKAPSPLDKGTDDQGEGGKPPSKAVQEAAQRKDAWMRRFAPKGVILRGLVNLTHWLTFGCIEQAPVFFSGDYAFLVRHPAAAPIRLAQKKDLRLAGLLWPEAAERIALTAYLSQESLGSGQVILFASSPAFRGYFRGTARLFGNAVVYGPSLGAEQPLEW
ncbi:MAG: M14 family zinc carboxypeptidase [Myxococcota bacterium]|nr:M14 family zinc carboxypeptidase [Myxococcota bacterium]